MNIRLSQGQLDVSAIGMVIEKAFCDEENKLIMNLVVELSEETISPSIK